MEKKILSQSVDNEENKIASLKDISDISTDIHKEYGDLIVCNANESHISEVAELWANHASIQQIFAPQKYSFKAEGKDWRAFVRRKLEKKNNLLLVMHKKGDIEVRGFLYLQTVTLPSSNLIVKGIIEDIYTKPQYRKQKVASRMLDIATDWAMSQGIKQVDILSLISTKGIVEFFEHFLKDFKKDLKIDLVNF